MLSNEQPTFYSFRTVTDSKGHEHYQFRMPTERGGAWVEVLDMTDNQQFLEQLMDPSFLPEWKLIWFQEQYEQFRDRENARKHGEITYGLESDLSAALGQLTSHDPHISVMRSELLTPDDYLQRIEEHEQAEAMLSVIDNPKHREWVSLSLEHQWKYTDIARQENPDADEATIEKKANTIGRAVKRALAKIQAAFPQACPVLDGRKDV